MHTALTITQQSALSAQLARFASDPAWRVYALLDGAPFEDLPGALAQAGIAHRSLYRNVQDAELIRAGPWLVDPYHLPDTGLNVWGGLPAANGSAGHDAVASDTQAALHAMRSGPDDGEPSFHAGGGPADPAAQIERLVAMVGDAPAAIFWIGDARLTEAALWRHLRTLNMVLIPKEYSSDDPSPSAAPEQRPAARGKDAKAATAGEAAVAVDDSETYDAVMFRHGDGNVLLQVLPQLTAAQFSRVFGPASNLLFLAPDFPASDGSILRRAMLPDDAPPAPAGLLTLTMEQMQGVEGARRERSKVRIMRYLREVAPEQTAGMSDAELARSTAAYMEEASSHGVSTEAGLGRWCYMQTATGGALGNSDDVKSLMRAREPDFSADDRVRLLLQATANDLAGRV